MPKAPTVPASWRPLTEAERQARWRAKMPWMRQALEAICNATSLQEAKALAEAGLKKPPTQENPK